MAVHGSAADADARRAKSPASSLRRTSTRRSFARCTTLSCAIRCCSFNAGELPPARQVAFARHFGEVQVHVMNQYHADGFPELYRLSNLDAARQARTAAIRTRARSPGTPTARGSASPGRRRSSTARSCRDVGGETHFCDMYGAYERLDSAWKARIADLRAVHNLDFSRTRRHGEDPMTEAQKRATPPVDHPDRAHASGDGPQVPLSRRPRGVRSRHAVRRRPRADRGAERACGASRISPTSIAGSPGSSSYGTTAASCIAQRLTTLRRSGASSAAARCWVRRPHNTRVGRPRPTSV